jgi:hypothetical protein
VLLLRPEGRRGRRRGVGRRSGGRGGEAEGVEEDEREIMA